jgi:hypothetical protein
MELRSESHTPAVEFYSTPRRDPNVKIFSDEEMSGLLEGLDESGFARFAAPGPGPRSGADGVTKVIEVERQGAVQHLASHPNASDDQRRLVSELTVGLAQVFNAKRAFQQIDDDRGGAIFLGPSAGGTP